MDEICQTYGFQTIQLTDKKMFDEAFGQLHHPLSDYTFANTYIWGSSLKLYRKTIERHVCVFANGTGDLTMFFPPLGEGNLKRCLEQCFEIMDHYNDHIAHDRSLSRIEYVSAELLERLEPFGLAAAPMGGDYVYDMQKMADLSGGELKSKRQSRNKFLREHRVFTEPLTKEHVPACKALLHLWQQQGDEKPTHELHREASLLRKRDTLATELALDSFEELGLTGMLLWADGRLAGFTLGQPLGARQASILIEKTDRNLDGSAQFIFSEFCRSYWLHIPECNVGDDWGIPSLRWTKESYRPIRLMSKYVVSTVRSPMLGWTPSVELPVANPAHLPAATETVTQKPQGVVEIASVSETDLDALVELERRAFTQGEAFSRKQLRYLLRSPRAVVKAAKVDDRVVGWVIALLRHHRRYDSARLYSLAVDPAYRGRGIGERLVRYVLQYLEEHEVHRCFLEVREENATAQRLYERLGFTFVCTLPNYYGEGQHGRRMLRTHEGDPKTAPVLSKPLGLM